MINVVFIVSDIDKAVAFEWIARYVDKKRFSLSFILLNPGSSILEDFLVKQNFTVQRVICRGKQDWPLAIFKVFKLLKLWRPEVVHCHMIQATILGLVAAKAAGIRKRIYTRHHSSLHHIYFRKGVWWDRLSNSMATHIIAISGIVKHILVEWEKAKLQKVIFVPHGFKLEDFQDVERDRILTFKEKYQLLDGNLIIGVISRFTVWKGVQYIIPAFKKLLLEYPNAVLLLLNAQGDYETELVTMLQSLPRSCYRMIKFENDIGAAYKCMDLFVHVPIDEHSEAFGQTYVESLAARVPSIFTLSGIASDFVEHERNAFVVPFKDDEAIYLQMKRVLQSRIGLEAVIQQGSKDVEQRFSLDKMIHSLEALYEA